MSNLVAGPAVPPKELIPGQKYEIRHNDIRIIGTYIGPHKSPGFSRFSVGNPENPERVFSNTYTFHPLTPPKSKTERLKLQQVYREEGLGGLPASALGLVGEYTNAEKPYDLYKDETTGTGTGVSLPRLPPRDATGGRKTRKRKTRKRKTRRQRR